VLQLALLNMAQKDYAGARAAAEEVLKKDAQDARAARIIFESYAAQNQAARGLARVTELAGAAPRSVAMQSLLGQWQLAAGHHAEAREAFEKAKTADPKSIAADLALAELDLRQNQAPAAARRLESVIAQDPNNVNALLMLAAIDKSAGRQEAAVARYRTVLNIDGRNLMALNNLSSALTSQSPDEALGFAQRALEVAPDNPAVQDTMGWICYRKGIYDAASRYLRAAVAKEPSPRRQYHLALSYMKSGETSLGQQMLQAALRQDPSLRDAKPEW
jgi:Tfp pilus assembly protein PilF